MTLQLLEKLQSHAKERPDEIATRQIIPDSGHVLSWRQLQEQVETLTADLKRDFPADATVMLCSGNRAEYVVAFLAILAAELTVFPIAPDIAAAELFSAAERSGAVALLSIGQEALPIQGAFATPRAMPQLSHDAILHVNLARSRRPCDGPALLLLSSGTTGQPKIVRRTAASVDAVSKAMVRAIGFSPADRVLATTPLCHSYGLEHGLLCPIWAGSATHFYERFDLPAAMKEIAGAGASVSIFPGVPFIFETLCQSADSIGTSPLRRAYSAGGPLPPNLARSFAERFGIPLSQLYGATEIGSVTYNDPTMLPFDPASVGRPMSGVSIRILDPSNPDLDQPLPMGAEGHVAISAPSMLSGYLNGEPAPLLGGYFLTGDLGRLDASSALTLTGRIKLLIDIAGRKVNPLEVERALCEHESVGECVVVPVKVSETLNRLKAFVTPREPGSPLDRAQLRAFAKTRLSAYKIPRIIEIRESLPRAATGKVMRHLLQ